MEFLLNALAYLIVLPISFIRLALSSNYSLLVCIWLPDDAIGKVLGSLNTIMDSDSSVATMFMRPSLC
jgi:hypothetical protein